MTSPTPQASSVNRVVLASFIGTTIEWYDFFLYGTAAALVFNKLFFPELSSTSGTMAAFATYAVGFFARPVGGVVFGHFGDRIGRKSMLVTTLMLMGMATFLIGLLPTYHQIGAAAPALLVLLRFIQGFGVGGEWGGAVLMAVEHGHGGRRGLYASWVHAGVPAGSLLATGVFTLVSSQMSDDQFLSWGWRIPFLLGIGLLGIGLFIRLSILESPLFEQAKQEGESSRLPFLDAIRRYPGNILLAIGARMAENACFYIFTAFVLSYATEYRNIPKPLILHGLLIASAVEFFAIPALGILSDRIGRRPVYLVGALGLAAYAFPFFALIDTGDRFKIWGALVIAELIHAAMYAPQAAFLSELFGTNVRYSAASIGYQLSAPLSGGIAPLIAAAMLKTTHGQPWPVAVYLIAMAAITVISVWLASETHRIKLDEA